MEKIVSTANERIKLLKKLSQKKYRAEHGIFLVENFVSIKDALTAGINWQELFLTKDFIDRNPDKAALLLAGGDSSITMIDHKVNKAFSQLDTPSGIAAVYPLRASRLTDGPVVYLNGINDPGNLGTILRSALAFDFVNIVIDDKCVDLYNPKTVSAAKDAIFKLNIIEDDGAWLGRNKLPVYTTSSHQGTPLKKFYPRQDYCLVLGSESHGVSIEIMQRSEENIIIETSGKIESLNVGTAASILFYELSRK